MQMIRLLACLTGAAVAGAACSRDSDSAGSEREAASVAESWGGEQPPAGDLAPERRPPVAEAEAEAGDAADSDDEGAEKGRDEGFRTSDDRAVKGRVDPAARVAAAVDEDRRLVAIGATTTKIIPLGTNTIDESDEYVVRLEKPEGVDVDAEGTIQVSVVPKDGWKLTEEAPTRLVVAPPSDVRVDRKNQGPREAVTFGEKLGKWAVKFRSKAAGKKDFTGTFQFAVCTEANTVCIPKRIPLAFAVEVK